MIMYLYIVEIDGLLSEFADFILLKLLSLPVHTKLAPSKSLSISTSIISALENHGR